MALTEGPDLELFVAPFVEGPAFESTYFFEVTVGQSTVAGSGGLVAQASIMRKAQWAAQATASLSSDARESAKAQAEAAVAASLFGEGGVQEFAAQESTATGAIVADGFIQPAYFRKTQRTIVTQTPKTLRTVTATTKRTVVASGLFD